MQIKAPFNADQVKALNRFQQSDRVHPFTCGNGNCRAVLVATAAGWVCPDCPYTQDWAHDLMLGPPPPFPAEAACAVE